MVIRMNKKGQIGISIAILILIIVGISVYQENLENKEFIGDSSLMVVYNIKSSNENCSVMNVKIDSKNVRLFETEEEALSKGFRLDGKCD